MASGRRDLIWALERNSDEVRLVVRTKPGVAHLGGEGPGQQPICAWGIGFDG
jgi:hypothetical protein